MCVQCSAKIWMMYIFKVLQWTNSNADVRATYGLLYHTVKYGTFLPKHPVYNLQTK